LSILVRENATIEAEGISESFFVVDGSNIAFDKKSSKNKPLFSNILSLKIMLAELGISKYIVICDKSLRYCISERSKYLRAVRKKQIVESPEGTQADIFILQFALRKNAYIISNDRFKEYYGIFDKEWIDSIRISFRIIKDEIYFDKLIKRGI